MMINYGDENKLYLFLWCIKILLLLLILDNYLLTLRNGLQGMVR